MTDSTHLAASSAILDGLASSRLSIRLQAAQALCLKEIVEELAQMNGRVSMRERCQADVARLRGPG